MILYTSISLSISLSLFLSLYMILYISFSVSIYLSLSMSSSIFSPLFLLPSYLSLSFYFPPLLGARHFLKIFFYFSVIRLSFVWYQLSSVKLSKKGEHNLSLRRLWNESYGKPVCFRYFNANRVFELFKIKIGHPRPLFCWHLVFSNKPFNFLQQFNVKNVHPVSGLGFELTTFWSGAFSHNHETSASAQTSL